MARTHVLLYWKDLVFFSPIVAPKLCIKSAQLYSVWRATCGQIARLGMGQMRGWESVEDLLLTWNRQIRHAQRNWVELSNHESFCLRKALPFSPLVLPPPWVWPSYFSYAARTTYLNLNNCARPWLCKKLSYISNQHLQ